MRDDVDDANDACDARFGAMDANYVGLGTSATSSESEDGRGEEEDGAMGVDDDSTDDEDERERESDDDDDEETDEDARDGMDDDEEEDGYSDSEEAALAKAMKAQRRRLEGRVRRDAVADEDEDEDEDEDGGFGIKGKRKVDFYGDDDVDHEGLSDEEDRMEEEKEARRMRKLMAEEMRAEDFGVESEEEAEDTLGAKVANLRRGDGKKSSTKKASAVEIETLTAEEREERLAAEDDAAAASDAPELVALTKELTSTLSAIEESVEPLVNAARNGAFATAEGISYLDTKYLLMLSYCSSIVFYLLLKSEGRSVKDHPVIERLVEIRLYLEKLRPIDKKLQYQVRRLTALSTTNKTRLFAAMVAATTTFGGDVNAHSIGLTTH